MHYTIDYSKIENPVAKQAKAIKDIKDYIGVKRFKQICAAIHGDQSLTREWFIESLAMLVGIEGYPAEAWADELGLVKASAETRTDLVESACKAAPEG